MLEAELDQQIAEREEADPEYNDSRNGYKRKTLRSSLGEIPIQVPQDRNSDFDPKIVPKYKKDVRYRCTALAHFVATESIPYDPKAGRSVDKRKMP